MDLEMFNIAELYKPGFTSFKKFFPVYGVFVDFIF
jgi:hypothetical protein